jgi:hypothetical protein
MSIAQLQTSSPVPTNRWDVINAEDIEEAEYEIVKED